MIFTGPDVELNSHSVKAAIMRLGKVNKELER